MHSKIRLILVIMIGLLVLSSPVWASSFGILDSGFGSGTGKIMDDLSHQEYIYDMAVQRDGKIVVVGQQLQDSDSLFLIARYDQYGYRDSGFNSNGWNVTNNGAGVEEAKAVGFQKDGKIIAAGIWNSNKIAVVRYMQNGTLDTSFGSSGIVHTQFLIDAPTNIGDLVIQPDDKIVVVGSVNLGSSNWNFALKRLNADGSIDTGFGESGLVHTDFESNSEDQARAAAIQPDGYIVVVGKKGGNFALARYDQSGTLDPEFGVNGVRVTTFSASTEAKAVTISRSGEIVVAGTQYTDSSYNNTMVALYDNEGFNISSGTNSFAFPQTYDHVNAVAVGWDQKVYIAGVHDESGTKDFGLMAFTPDMNMDDSFGSAGSTTTDFTYPAFANAMVVSPFGKIYVAGHVETTSGGFDIAISAYSGPKVIFVSTIDGNDSNSGQDWMNAVKTIGAGIGIAENGGEVWVKEGTYVETITLKENVSLFGGFKTGETSVNRSVRDPKINETIIDGNGSSSVVTSANIALINGFTIKGGQASNGGGINIMHSIIIERCIIKDNQTSGYGGGIYVSGTLNPPPHIMQCAFENNSAANGGGLYVNSTDINISDSIFKANTASNGGGLYASSISGDINIDRVIFEENTADLYGGGIYNSMASPHIENSIFHQNQANPASTGGGGAVANVEASPVFINCVLYGNHSTGQGGAIHNSSLSSPELKNTITYANTSNSGASIYNASVDDQPQISYCNIAGSGGGSNNNIDADPLFTVPEYGDFSLLPASPCINTGTSTDAPYRDFFGQKRIGLHDMGAVEFQDTPLTSVPPGTYYVNPAGNNDNDGTSAASPWKTLHHAFNLINNGTSGNYILNLAAGNYSVNDNGEDDDALILTQNNVNIIGSSAIISSTGSSSWPNGFKINGSNINIYSVVVTDFSGAGILLSAGNTDILGCQISKNYVGVLMEPLSQNNSISSCKIFNNTSAGIEIKGSSGNQIKDNTGEAIYNNGSSSPTNAGIGISVLTATNNSISNNDIYWGGDLSHYQGTGISVTNCDNTNIISDNRIYDHFTTVPDAHFVGIQINDSHADISKNILYDNYKGIFCYASSSLVANITNNLIYEKAAKQVYGIYLYNESGTMTPIIYHNTLIGTENSNSSYGIIMEGTVTGEIKYNLISGYDIGISQDGTTAPAITYNDLHATTPYEISGVSEIIDGVNSNITADPQFVDPSSYDFHLDEYNSPAVDSIDITPTVLKDLDGNDRPEGEASDMGCYETSMYIYSWDLEVVIKPVGAGSVKGNSGSPLNCPNNCNVPYEDGGQETLTATPNSGYVFDYWSGDAIGTSNSADIEMDDHKSITANFRSVWTQINTNGFGGDTNGVQCLLVHKESLILYAGTENSTSGAQLWRYIDSSWTQVITEWDSNTTAINSMINFNGSIYIGTIKSSGAELWKLSTSIWTKIKSLSSFYAIPSMAVFNGSLYFGTSGSAAQVWECDSNDLCTQVTTDWSSDNTSAYSMAVFNSKLFVGTANSSDGGELWSFNGTQWANVGRASADTYRIDTMVVYQNRLFCGTYRDNGAEIWTYDGSNMVKQNIPDLSASNIIIDSMTVYDDKLYCGTSASGQGGEVGQYDGTTWTRLEGNGFGDVNNGITALAGSDALIAGTYNHINHAQVWQYQAPVTNYSLSMTLSPSQAGYVTVGSHSCDDHCSWDYAQDTELILTAVPVSGYTFSSWEIDGHSYSQNPYTLTMNNTHNVSAVFTSSTPSYQQYSLSLAVSPNSAWGSISAVPVSSDLGYALTCPGSCSGYYEAGTTLQIVATPAQGYEFVYWEGSISGSEHSTSVIMSADQSITGIFSEKVDSDVYTLALEVTPDNGGAVTNGTTTCSSICSEELASGTLVQLTAVPADGYEFDQWEGDLSGKTVGASVTMDADKSIKAVFKPREYQYILNVTLSPQEGGSVVGGNEINCPGQCSASYAAAYEVNLQAIPTDGYEFAGWQGASQEVGTDITIMMDNDQQVTALFQKIKPAVSAVLSLGVSPQNAGFLITDGLNCPDICSGTFTDSAILSVTATANSGYIFDYWEGALSGTANPSNLVMDADKTLTAVFKTAIPPELPVIEYPTMDTPVPAGPVILKASAYTGSNTHAASIWMIRKYGQPAYDFEETTTGVSEHTIIGLIPGMKYTWTVSYRDSEGLVSKSEEMSFRIGTSVIDRGLKIQEGVNPEDYAMISVMQWLDASLCSDVIGAYNPDYIRIGTYDAVRGEYIECGEGLPLEPGRAYWALARREVTFNSFGIPVSGEVDIDVALHYDPSTDNGWNMIAPPNNSVYAWADMQVLVYDQSGHLIYGPSRISADNPYLDMRLWRWEKGAYYDDTITLEPYNGYWVKAKASNVYLRFPSSAQQLKKGRRVEPNNAVASGDTPPMPMGLETQSGGGASSSCFIFTAVE